MVKKLRNYINGQWSDVSDAQTLDVMNPATGEVLAHVPLSQIGRASCRERV